MKTEISLDQDIRKLLTKFDVDFYLKYNIKDNFYKNINADEVKKGITDSKKQLKLILKENKEQAILKMEGDVRKMYSGGLLASFFRINEGRSSSVLDSYEYGVNLGIFEIWQKYERRRIAKEQIWNIIIRIGTVLAYILSVIKIYELIFQS